MWNRIVEDVKFDPVEMAIYYVCSIPLWFGAGIFCGAIWLGLFD